MANNNRYFNREAAAELMPDHSSLIPPEQQVFDPIREGVASQAFDSAENKWEDYNNERERLKDLAKQRVLDNKRKRHAAIIATNKSKAIASEKYEQSKAITPEVIESQDRAGVPSAASKLFRQIGVNLDFKFNKQDTYDLIGALLSCNEAQLEALMDNTRVPISVKTIIKVILEDYRNGSMVTIDKLWTRLYGTSFEKEKAQNSTTVNILSMLPGIDGSKPISREGYALIKNKLFGAADD